MSSCAASCSTCCPKACTRSATPASGTRLGAGTLNAPVSCSCSTTRQRRVQRHYPPRRATAPPIGRPITNHPMRHESDHAVSSAVSFASAAFPPNRHADHDRYSIATTIITALVQACPDQATADLCLPLARLRLVAPDRQPPPRMTPPDNLDGALPRPRPFGPTGYPSPRSTSAQLKIP